LALYQGTTSVVPLADQKDSGFTGCGKLNSLKGGMIGEIGALGGSILPQPAWILEAIHRIVSNRLHRVRDVGRRHSRYVVSRSGAAKLELG
jgi:hypothetical protein